jgi:hypothetical protein
MRKSSLGRFFAIETTAIEAFDSTGERWGGTSANAYITTTVGACTLTTPRGMAFTKDNDYMVVTNTGATTASRLLWYNVSSNSASSCVQADTATFNGMNPVPILQHSNGLLYVGTQGNDRIYSITQAGASATIVFNTNTTVMGDPVAMIELPDGSILVASDLTDSIERIDTSGNRIGSTSFIKNAFTGTMTDMMLIGGQ